VESSRQRWLQVCRARGTPAPESAQVARFLVNLQHEAQVALDQALLLCLHGREKLRELEVVSWAAACTRPSLLARVQAHGLACTGHDLFAAGLGLMAQGWDMSARLAQLASNPQDIDALRSMLALQAPTSSVEEDAVQAAVLQTHSDKARPVLPGPAGQSQRPSSPPAPEPEPSERYEQYAPAWEPDARTRPSLNAVPPLHAKTSEQEAPAFEPLEQEQDRSRDFEQDGQQRRLQVRLFGKEAAHTLEIGPHRRGGSFMGVQVVTVESARALPGGGYDWGCKLTVQLTPEEMPSAIAVLMNLCPSARFGQHGPDRDKFVELRRQEGGMVVVTGQGSSVYAVPVKTTTLYYLLTLFARAMAQGLQGGSIAEVLALVKASQ
jgi:hypothetical protein